jgi:hypothetical protein
VIPNASLLKVLLVLLHAGALQRVALHVVEGVEWLERGVLVESHPALEEVRSGLGHVVGHVRAGRDGEDVVEFFEGALLGFWDPVCA